MTPFRIKPNLVATPISEHVSFSDEGPLYETLGLLEISYDSYQPVNFLPGCKIIGFVYVEQITVVYIVKTSLDRV